MDKMLQSETIIPAQPGWLLLTPDDGTSEASTAPVAALYAEPIIAWRIVVSGTEEQRRRGHEVITPEPITLAGNDHASSSEAAVLRPDGKVESALIGVWDSKEEFLQFLNEERAKRKPRAVA